MYRNTWVEVNLDAIYDNVKTTKDGSLGVIKNIEF